MGITMESFHSTGSSPTLQYVLNSPSRSALPSSCTINNIVRVMLSAPGAMSSLAASRAATSSPMTKAEFSALVASGSSSLGVGSSYVTGCGKDVSAASSARSSVLIPRRMAKVGTRVFISLTSKHTSGRDLEHPETRSHGKAVAFPAVWFHVPSPFDFPEFHVYSCAFFSLALSNYGRCLRVVENSPVKLRRLFR